MELARLTSRCQLTLPRAVRQKLGVKEGDKVVFLEENGRIFIENAEICPTGTQRRIAPPLRRLPVVCKRTGIYGQTAQIEK